MHVCCAVGCERSGNTMFARLLEEHPETLVLAEVKFVQEAVLRLAPWLPGGDPDTSRRLLAGIRDILAGSKYLNYDSPWNRRVKDLLATTLERVRGAAGHPGFVEFLDQFHRTCAETGARVLVYGEPSLVYFLHELTALQPDRPLRHVLLLRNGIDVANSISKVATMPSGSFGPAMRWKRAIKAWGEFRRDFPHVPALEVRYEDLVDRDRFGPAMREVYDFLAITPSASRNLSPLMSRENFERSRSTVPEPQHAAVTIDRDVVAFLLEEPLRDCGYPCPDSSLSGPDRLTLKQRELEYWLEVRREVGRGQLAYR